MSSTDVPQTHRVLLLTSPTETPTVTTRPIPTVVAGSALVRVLAAPVLSYAKEVYPPNNVRGYSYPLPMVPGGSCVGRVAAVAEDATTLTEDTLVLVDSFLRARDGAGAATGGRALMGLHDGHDGSSKRLMAGVWRDGSFAQFVRAPLENCFVLDQQRLCGAVPKGLGYAVEDLVGINACLVPYGGLRDVGLMSGETVVVVPATGGFGGAAVLVALAMGAKVVAMGRNRDILHRLWEMGRKMYGEGRVETVPITGDVEGDTQSIKDVARGAVDVVFDISPPAAKDSTHLKSAIMALRTGGRVSLMGGVRGDVGIPHHFVMHYDITLKGKWMYRPEDVVSLIKLVENGILKIGKAAGVGEVDAFGLDQWQEAFECASVKTGPGMKTVIVP